MMRLKCRVLHTEKRRTMAGSVYQAPQRRFAVDGTCQMERRTDSKKCDAAIRMSGKAG